MNKIYIIGSGSLITSYLIPVLSKNGYCGTVLGRSKYNPESSNFTWEYLDVNSNIEWKAEKNTNIISLLPIWLLKNILPTIKECKQIIALSSSSIETKQQQDEEKYLVNKLSEGERAVQNFSKENDVPYTLLRPSMIYDGINDKNIAVISNFINRYHFFPVLEPATGLRQPICVEDLVNVIMKSINNENVDNKILPIAGGEKLTYREMLHKIFEVNGIKPRIIPIPKGLLKLLLKCLNRFKNISYTIGMFERMSQDMVFDNAEAEKLLDYKPRPFKLN